MTGFPHKTNEPEARASSPKAGLAPMEGVTDFATRFWFQMVGGMDFTWTPFLRVTDTFPLRYSHDFAPELDQLRGAFQAPLILQVMGSRPDDVIRTHDLYGDRIAFIDLNCGCPSPTVVGSRAGSSLLERQDFFGQFVSRVIAGVGAGRLSVKMRTGFHAASEFPGLFDSVNNLPLRHLTIHGRTRPDKYKGRADWGLIDRASRSTLLPVVGSGDLNSYAAIKRAFLDMPALAGVIVGRGALRNPWIFTDAESAPVLSAFVLFVALQDWQLRDLSGLISFAAQNAPLTPAGRDPDRWRELLARLATAAGLGATSAGDIDVSPRALSRGKMLWNYLRTSLPAPFMEPTLMRSRSLPELTRGIEAIAAAGQFDLASLPLSYQSQYDWMFSGEGKNPDAGRE